MNFVAPVIILAILGLASSSDFNATGPDESLYWELNNNDLADLYYNGNAKQHINVHVKRPTFSRNAL